MSTFYRYQSSTAELEATLRQKDLQLTELVKERAHTAQMLREKDVELSDLSAELAAERSKAAQACKHACQPTCSTHVDTLANAHQCD